MVIRFACEKCACPFTVDETKAGKRTKCPVCANFLTVPNASTLPEPNLDEIPTAVPVDLGTPITPPPAAPKPITTESIPVVTTKIPTPPALPKVDIAPKAVSAQVVTTTPPPKAQVSAPVAKSETPKPTGVAIPSATPAVSKTPTPPKIEIPAPKAVTPVPLTAPPVEVPPISEVGEETAGGNVVDQATVADEDAIFRMLMDAPSSSEAQPPANPLEETQMFGGATDETQGAPKPAVAKLPEPPKQAPPRAKEPVPAKAPALNAPDAAAAAIKRAREGR